MKKRSSSNKWEGQVEEDPLKGGQKLPKNGYKKKYITIIYPKYGTGPGKNHMPHVSSVLENKSFIGYNYTMVLELTKLNFELINQF